MIYHDIIMIHLLSIIRDISKIPHAALFFFTVNLYASPPYSISLFPRVFPPGPLLPEYLDVRNIPLSQRRELTVDLSSK